MISTEGLDLPASPELDPRTIGGLLSHAATRWPDREALVIAGRRYTYRDLFDDAMTWARGLVGIGVEPGDHVGILLPNCGDYIVLVYACALAGARAFTINARYREDDLGYVLDAADVEVLFIGGHARPHLDFRGLLTKLDPALADWDGRSPIALPGKLATIFNLGDPSETAWPTEADLGRAAQRVTPEEVLARARAVHPQDVFLMMFSSGTTARPKGCMLTHDSLIATGRALARRWRMNENDRIWDPMPFFHMSTILPLLACGSVGAAMIARMAFDATAGLEELEREQATISYASFPTIMSALVSHPDFAKRDLSRLRIVHLVGPADMLRRYASFFPQASIANAYGLTEASGVPVYSDPDDSREVCITTNGRPFDGVVIRIVDPESGLEAMPGRRGEIWIRGFCVFAGYYKDPDGTRRAITPDGWLRTGDIGSLDADGRVIYHGRLKDMLKIGGENVAAIEIENFLQTHPDVLVAQVIGVPDDHLLEVAAAYVELRPGATLAPEDIVRYCAGRIASFKVPRYVRIVTQWPMSATKIQKFELLNAFKPEGKFDVRAIIAQVPGASGPRAG